jgi:hypothetical protein
MIQIGDKVKFNEYLPHNYMTNQILRRTLGTKIRIVNRRIVTERLEHISKYKSIIINEREPLEGIYVGTFRKKLIRSYRRTEPINEAINDFLGLRGLRVVQPVIEFHDPSRVTNNPRRIDNPRQLNKMAMIKIGKRLIGVPMANVLKCNFGNTFKII